jgi:hypothetical protein
MAMHLDPKTRAERDAKILELLKKGYKAAEICGQFRMSASTLNQLSYNLGFRRRDAKNNTEVIGAQN